MKICIISNLKDKGYGESTRPYYLSVELQKRGYSILHICEKSESVDANGIHYIPLNRFKFSNRLLNRIFNFIYLTIKIRAFGPELIYVHQFNNARWAIASRTLPKVPLVFDAHTSVSFEASSFGIEEGKVQYVFGLEKAVCLQSDFIIAASQPTKELLMKQYNINDEKIYVVGNATSIKPVAKPKELNDADFVCSTTLPFDGFISNTWALEFLFEVAKKTYEANKKIIFQVLGGGTKPEPPCPNIRYTGYVERLEDYLLPSHVCLASYPAKAVCGGIRNKVCDYLALGKAIVSTKEGMRGFMEVVNGKDYLEADSVEDFSAAILKLYNDKELRKKLEANALALSYTYQWNKRAEKVDEIFKRIRSGAIKATKA